MERFYTELEVRRSPELAHCVLGEYGPGVLPIEHFIGGAALEGMQEESENPFRVSWQDAHESYYNQRGLYIVQNHDVYALKLDRGRQGPTKRIPHAVAAMRSVTRFVRSLSSELPSLTDWKPDELSMHRYDNPDLGLSFHRDNKRFIGVIAVLSFEGECELKVRQHEHDRSHS